MDKNLFMKAIGRFIMGVILTALLLFVPAGTLHYWHGWLLMAVLIVPMFSAGMVMLCRSPELLKWRLSAKEAQSEQRQVVALSAAMFLAVFVMAGLNFRFKWLTLPDWVSWTAAGLFLAGYALYAEVLRENVWLSRTVEVQHNQTVVDTGLYGVVRHPMYAATLLLFLSMPLMLGSPISFVITLLYIPIIVKRIRNEEAVLATGLKGYAAYMQRVKYRLIPHIW